MCFDGKLINKYHRWLDHALWTPSRTYSKEENSVGREYDAWAEVRILFSTAKI
jgi:hypothetical protein